MKLNKSQQIYYNNYHECLVLLDSTFRRYKEKPRWELIQAMMRLAFQLGYEAARCQILHNIDVKK